MASKNSELWPQARRARDTLLHRQYVTAATTSGSSTTLK